MFLRMIAIIFSDAVYIMFSYILGSMTTAVVHRNHVRMEEGLVFAGLMMCVLVITPLLLYASNNMVLKQSITGDEEYLKKVLNQFPARIIRKDSGKLSSEIIDILIQLRWAVIDLFVYRCEFAAMMIAFIVLVLKTSVHYSLLILMLVVFSGFKSKIVTARLNKWKIQEMDAEERINHQIYESVEAFDSLYLNQYNNVAVSKINEEMDQFAENILKRKNIAVVGCEMIARYIDDFFYIMILVYGLFLMKQGVIEIGAIVTMSFYYNILSMQFKNVEKLFESKGMIKRTAKIAADLVDQQHPVKDDVFFSIKIFPFTFQNGEFTLSYEDTIEIKPGDKVAIIGENGSGKTTMLYLLLGIYKAPDEAFRINGQKYDCSRMRGWCSYIDVDSDLMEEQVDKYIRANVKLKDCNVAIGRFDIEGLLSSCGTELSGGERRRIDTVRVMVENKPILAMDEPEVFLDNNWKKQLLDFVKEQKNTIIYTTHDPEFIKAATKVIHV